MNEPECQPVSSRESVDPKLECEVLIEAAIPEIYQRNTFRIFGLGVDATIREVTRHANRVKQMAELGLPMEAQTVAFPIKPAPTSDDLRAALLRFQDSELRLLDEFFWFWPSDFEGMAPDAAWQALKSGDGESAVRFWSQQEREPAANGVATHNLAIYWHMRALDLDLTPAAETSLSESDPCWSQALTRWDKLLLMEPFWERFRSRIGSLKDPRLTTGFAYRFRRSLPQALALINGHLALRYADANRPEKAKIQAGYLRGSTPTRPEVHQAVDRLLTASRRHLDESARTAERSAAAEPHERDRYAESLLNLGLRLLPSFTLLGIERTSHDLFNEIVECCHRIQQGHHRVTQNEQRSIEILKKAQALVSSAKIEALLETVLETLVAQHAARHTSFDPSSSRNRTENHPTRDQSVEGVLNRHFGEPRMEILLRKFSHLCDSESSPAQRLELVQSTLQAKILCALSELSPEQEPFRVLAAAAFHLLRRISLRAAEVTDFTTALKANELAFKFAHSPEQLNLLSLDRNRFSLLLNNPQTKPESRQSATRGQPTRLENDVLSELMQRVRDKYFQGASLDQVIEELNRLRGLPGTPSSRLRTFRTNWYVQMRGALQDLGCLPNAQRRLTETIVGVLRAISLQALKQGNDLDTAIGANQLATELANTPQLHAALSQDRKRLKPRLEPAEPEEPKPNPNPIPTVLSIALLLSLVILVIWAARSRNTKPDPGGSPHSQYSK